MFPARDGDVFHEVRSFLKQVVCKQCWTGIQESAKSRTITRYERERIGLSEKSDWAVDSEIESN